LASKRKTYKIRGMYYQQQALTYRELTEVWRLTKGRFKKFAANQQAFGEWIDELIEHDLLPKLCKIILKPYKPTVFHKWWNQRQTKKLGITPDNFADVLSADPVVGRVLGDFFLLNTSWTLGLFNSWMSSASPSKKALHPILSQLLNSFTQPVEASSVSASASETQTPKK